MPIYRPSPAMLTFRTIAANSLLLLVAMSCGKKETPEYRLTAEQLAWQPYHMGDVVRFGQARTSKVRTFAIGEVSDRVETYCNNCGGGINLGPGGSSKLQQVRVDFRRTDTVRYMPSPSSTPTRPDSVPITYPNTLLEMRVDDNNGSGPVVVRSEIRWDFSFYNYLPIQEVVASQALPDTTARLLPSLQLGGVTYGPVIQLSNNPLASPQLPRTKPVRRIYYAKGVGVVAFIEGNTLWYKLP